MITCDHTEDCRVAHAKHNDCPVCLARKHAEMKGLVRSIAKCWECDEPHPVATIELAELLDELAALVKEEKT